MAALYRLWIAIQPLERSDVTANARSSSWWWRGQIWAFFFLFVFSSFSSTTWA